MPPAGPFLAKKDQKANSHRATCNRRAERARYRFFFWRGSAPRGVYREVLRAADPNQMLACGKHAICGGWSASDFAPIRGSFEVLCAANSNDLPAGGRHTFSYLAIRKCPPEAPAPICPAGQNQKGQAPTPEKKAPIPRTGAKAPPMPQRHKLSGGDRV